MFETVVAKDPFIIVVVVAMPHGITLAAPFPSKRLIKSHTGEKLCAE
jgi:hypothetical protein